MQLFPGQQFVITGKFVGIPRAALRSRIEAVGGIVSDHLSDSTFVLLAGIGSAEQKISKATELGVAVVTPPELGALFAENPTPPTRDAEASRRPGPRRTVPPGFLAEDAVNKVTLAALLSRACYRTSYDENGDLAVEADGGRIVVLIDQRRRLIRLITFFVVKEHADEGAKFVVANRMNRTFEQAKFCLASPTLIAADYAVPFDQGIGASQLVATLRRFESSVLGAVRTCDVEDVLE